MVLPVVIDFSINGQRYPNLNAGMKHLAKRMSLDPKKVQVMLKAEIKALLDEVATEMERRHSGTFKSVDDKAPSLAMRSGEAVKSIRRSIVISGRSLADTQGQIGGLPHLKAHEFGATIRPKNSQYLTIPLPAALDKRGLPKKQKARDWDRTFISRSSKGRLLIWRRLGRRIIPLYLLVGPGESPDHVKIPARLGMVKATQDRMSKFADRLADRILKEGFYVNAQ